MRQLHRTIYIYNFINLYLKPLTTFILKQIFYMIVLRKILEKIAIRDDISVLLFNIKDCVYVSYAIIGILNFMSAYDIFIASIILDVKLPTNDFFEIHKD